MISAEQQTINDSAAHQQVKQTMAIGLMVNPAIPLPFPLYLLLGVTTLVYPNDRQRPTADS